MKIHKNKRIILLLFGVVFLGFLLRIVGINWDSGYYLHPDERAIFLFTLPISLPESISAFFSPESPLNPNFFAYGSLPLYLLRFALFLSSFFSPALGGYGEGYFVGRTIAVVIDTFTIMLVYLLGRRVFSATVGLLGAFFYAIAVFPIQNSHFYTTDVFLAFFLLLSLLFFLYFFESSKRYFLLFSAITFGMALASKVSALPFLLVICVGLFTHFFILPYLKHKKTKNIFHLLFIFLRAFFTYAGISLVTFLLFEPYAVLDFSTFWAQISEQRRMTENAFTFPYTLQYVGKVPYFYELKQIFFWGLGLPLSLLSFGGFVYFLATTIRNLSCKYLRKQFSSLLLSFFFILYFGIVGSFAVGWMRYMLPLYPYLTLFAAFFSAFLFQKLVTFHFFKKRSILRNSVVVIFLLGCSIWTFSFLRIYFEKHPRVAASEWIHTHIPPGASLAAEHWDDPVPLYNIEQYNLVILPLYERDTPEKWENMSQLLKNADYILITSHRLYEPLIRLSEKCNTVPSEFCYRETSQYYHDLFSGAMGYKKVAEFSNFPTVPFLGVQIIDQTADESFTVYDHPVVTIFRKTTE